MKKSALLVALSAASLAGGVALAQTQPYSGTKPATDTKPETTRPAEPQTGCGCRDQLELQPGAAGHEQRWFRRQDRSEGLRKPVRDI